MWEGGARTFTAAVLLLSMVTVYPCVASEVDLDRPIQFHIAAQSLGSALVEFARKTGLQVLVASGDVQGLESSTIDGSISPRAALKQMLKGSKLQYQQVGADTIAISKIAPAEAHSPSLPPISVLRPPAVLAGAPEKGSVT